MNRARYRRNGLTRIELLTLLSTLTIFIAMLPPARVALTRIGQREACKRNLRFILRGMQQYAMDNDDWIVGSPAGSGAYLLGQSQAFGPAVQVWDFMGILKHQWTPSLPLPQPGDLQAVIDRFNNLRSTLPFIDPANNFQATRFDGPAAGIGPMVSYNTFRTQLFLESGDFPGLTTLPRSFGEFLPSGWRPSVTAMGNPANKVFCADGARYSATTISPDYDLVVNASYGGTFSAQAPYSRLTHSWDRSWANGSRIGMDARKYAYRHSDAKPPPAPPPNAFKMNLAFYDGHVETQGDLTSTDPQQWLPTGSYLLARNTWADTRIEFSLPWVVVIGD